MNILISCIKTGINKVSHSEFLHIKGGSEVMIRIGSLVACSLFLVYLVLVLNTGFKKHFCEEDSGKEPLIPKISSQEILAEIQAGKKVVFIDAREEKEFQEEHIPGAQNLTLRDVNVEAVKRFADADFVIPYCLKDFRGFELGKALQRFGLKNVYELQLPGINYWKAQGLPVAGERGLSDDEALRRMQNNLNFSYEEGRSL